MILYNSGKNKTFFELERGIRPWDIIFTVSNGCFSLEFPEDEEIVIFHPYEVAYIPANTPFVRKVIEPIDFYQFAFKRLDDDVIYKGLERGKLHPSKAHVKTLLESAERLSAFPEQQDLSLGILSFLLTENYIFSRDNGQSVSGLSRETAYAINYINAHLHEKIDISALADEVYLSHTGLIWKFKKELNTTPSDYLIAARMQHAKMLLLENNISVSEIAEQCGYANVYYFSNAFRNYTGKSPSDFRKAYLN